MNCSTCGVRLTHAGQGHRCMGGTVPQVVLPLRWQIAWWALLLLTAALGTRSLTKAAIAADVLESSGRQIPVVLSAALAAALVVTFVVWARLTKAIVEAHGGTTAVVRNRALSGAAVLVVVSLVLSSDTAPFHLVRVAAAALLLVGVAVARAKIESWLASADRPSGAGAETVAAPSWNGSPSPEPRPEDRDAGRWDPEIQADIERRGHGESR